MRLNYVVTGISLRFQTESKDIRQLMLPITISGWLAGRGIIEFPLGKRWPVASCIYSLVLIVGSCIAVKSSLDNVHLIRPSVTSKFGSLVFDALICSCIWVNACNTFIGWKSIDGVGNIIDRLEACGRKMEKRGIPQKYGPLLRRQLVTLIGEILYVFFIVSVIYQWAQKDDKLLWISVTLAISLHSPAITICLGDATFIALVRSLNLKFEQLNQALKEMSTTTSDSPQHQRILERTISKPRYVGNPSKKRTNDDADAMRMAQEDHHELVKVGGSINEILGTQALLSMSYSFVFSIAFVYRAVGLFVWSTVDKNYLFEEVATLLSWMIFNGYKVIVMTLACAKASEECRETAVIVCQLHEPSTSKSFRDQIHNFSLQLTRHTVQFTACGMFPLDRSLIHGMFATIATYLIILVQIGHSSPSTKGRRLSNIED